MTFPTRPLGALACASLLAVTALSGPTSAQRSPTASPDLGLPELPPVTASSPTDSLLYADRVAYDQADDEIYAGSTPPVMFDGFLPPAETGTIFPEIFKYQLGNAYDANGPAHPMVVAYHGFGASAASVANQSTIDEECDARGWIYMAPTGIDDKLFGSPISQQHVEVAIQWMIDNFNVDPDRIYMVGFSMGGGITANFAARHRDPEGVMIAAVGMVSATLDWTQEYVLGFPQLSDWLENEYNFNGPPSTEPFAYKQASAVYFDEGTYPPLPGTIVAEETMSSNLLDLPFYITYDALDVLTQVPLVNAGFDTWLQNQGASVTSTVVSGTINPDNGQPATHSWIVLDEVALFDFFDGVVLDREPDSFDALVDIDATVSWLDVEKRFANEFTRVSGDRDTGTSTISITDVDNMVQGSIDADDAGLTAMPSVVAGSIDNRGFNLLLTDTVSPASYAFDTVAGDIVPLSTYDPLTGDIQLLIGSMQDLEADVVFEPQWDAVLTSTPHPVSVGGASSLTLDGPTGAALSWVFVGVNETLYTIKGLPFAVDSAVPGFILPALPHDGNGDLTLPVGIPNNPAFAGLRLPIQAVLTDGAFAPISVSNIWGFEIE